MTRTFSGIQPTGEPHLGNYLGAVQTWVAAQGAGESLYCVVDLHALTVPQDPGELHKATLGMATLLLAAGLDPELCTIFLQSHVPAHTELAWLLQCTASVGELRRMTQFKDKTAKAGDEAARAGLFTYPVLMAADILLYQTTHVPVGDDQRQHLELTRDLAERFNTRYGQVFTVPEAMIAAAGRGARVMDLAEPTRKMSKSAESEAGLIGLFDDAHTVERKLRKAVTDTDEGPGCVRWDPQRKPGVTNLLQILGVATRRDPVALAEGYHRYGDLKVDTAAAVVALLAPLQERYRELEGRPEMVTEVLVAGAAKARSLASSTLERAREALGLVAEGPSPGAFSVA